MGRERRAVLADDKGGAHDAPPGGKLGAENVQRLGSVWDLPPKGRLATLKRLAKLPCVRGQIDRIEFARKPEQSLVVTPASLADDNAWQVWPLWSNHDS